MSTDQKHKVIADWIGDVVALESHVEEALDHQLKLKSDSTALTSAIQRFHDTVRDSKRRAVSYEETYGTQASKGIIERGSELLGKAAGIIDRLRHDSVSKALRDDFTAFNHTAMAYQMLHATAMALGDSATEAFAGEGLRTYATLVQDVNQVISEAVILDLQGSPDYPDVDTTAIDHCRNFINQTWKATSNT
ncbi:MAG TPA: hypothetical protein VGR22_02850 [Thermomicrobiales bacterium]|nr:hypothetical protein [Thermomicrobiales bacterium]